MRIACITNSLIPSSTANSIQVMKVCDAMRQSGHEICLWAPGSYNAEFTQLKAQYGLGSDFEVRWIPSVKRLKRYDFSIATLNEARRWQPDIIYTWLQQVAVGTQLLGMQTVLEMHDRAHGRFGPYWLRKFMQSNRKKGLVVVSQALREALEVQAGFRMQDAEVVIAPNGVDLERFEHLPSQAQARKELGLVEGLTLGYTGHFYAGRGVNLLFHLAQAFPQVQHLWIGGREQELEVVRHRLDDRKLKNVTLTGFVENASLPLYQAACDILLMPYERSIAGSSGGNSADICSPMKMFEYMAAGRAIVSSDLPVIHEVLSEDEAIFCPPEDTAAWTLAVGELIADESRRTRIGRNARKLAESYTIKARQQRILAMFGLEG